MTESSEQHSNEKKKVLGIEVNTILTGLMALVIGGIYTDVNSQTKKMAAMEVLMQQTKEEMSELKQESKIQLDQRLQLSVQLTRLELRLTNLEEKINANSGAIQSKPDRN